MYDGYQVLRFENNYKSKDLYLIGNEMNNRIGTGNYDKERTKFNIKYKELEKDKGVTISSGPKFFYNSGFTI